MTKERVLVSACLLGERVRYDGGHCRSLHPILERWRQEGRIVPFCPEVSAGLPIPRMPAEIESGDAIGVLRGHLRVFNAVGEDVTLAFLRGAEKALALCRRYRIHVAVLKESSPSCGVHWVHDGRFSRRKIPGMGVTACVLFREGIQVFSEEQLDEADRALSA